MCLKCSQRGIRAHGLIQYDIRENSKRKSLTLFSNLCYSHYVAVRTHWLLSNIHISLMLRNYLQYIQVGEVLLHQSSTEIYIIYPRQYTLPRQYAKYNVCSSFIHIHSKASHKQSFSYLLFKLYLDIQRICLIQRQYAKSSNCFNSFLLLRMGLRVIYLLDKLKIRCRNSRCLLWLKKSSRICHSRYSRFTSQRRVVIP